MSSAFRRTLPARADLEHQKKLAKELLADYERGDNTARARVRAELPDKSAIALADAQFVIAREYGFASWTALKDHIDALVGEAVPPVEQFKRAIQKRDAKELRRVLERHREARDAINEPYFSFDTPALVNVAGQNDVGLVNVLLEFGADPNRRSSWIPGGFHPLHIATGAVANRLIAGGSVPDACAAAHLDRVDLLEKLLREDPSRAHERGGDGQTPLHFARSRAAIDMLLDAGADIDARDVDHHATAAEWMLSDARDPRKSRIALAKYLVDRGATADIFLAAALGLTDRARALVAEDPSVLELRTGQGAYAEKPPGSYHIYLWAIGPSFTPMQTAAHFNQMETLAALSEQSPPTQRLLLACHDGNSDEARAIVRANPGIVESLTGADRRALTDEAWTANAPAVELMMELGFDPSVRAVTGATGGTALHCAAWEGAVECVAAILEYPSGRALLEDKDTTYGGTPLGWCCHGSTNCGNPRANHAEVARLLIAAGATPDPNMRGCSARVQRVLDAALSASKNEGAS
jgi:ankyrin repeat protein